MYPTGVATIQKDEPDNHDGVAAGAVLAGDTDGTYWNWGIFQFNVPNSPSGHSPKFWVYLGWNYLHAGDSIFKVSLLASNPDMSTVTWNSCPSISATASDTELIPDQGVDGIETGVGWYSFDVGDIVTNSGIVTLALYGTQSTTQRSSHGAFRDETAGALSPYLELVDYVVSDDIYVDPVNGLNTNAGTLSSPLASLSLAASRVNANGTVHIKAGSVWAPSAGQIGPTNKPVTYYIY